MNALYSVYSLHISSSKIKLLLRICKGLTNSDFLLCSYFYVVLQVNLKALKMLKLFLNNLICEVEMSVIRH